MTPQVQRRMTLTFYLEPIWILFKTGGVYSAKTKISKLMMTGVYFDLCHIFGYTPLCMSTRAVLATKPRLFCNITSVVASA